MDHFDNPRHGYRMTDADAVGTAGTPGRGPFMVIYLKLDGDLISRASFQTHGCAPAIAAGSLLAERLCGARREAAATWDAQELERALGGLPRHKRHCPDLAARALAAALRGDDGGSP